jgi:Raf kinase inhibitor-like YbhB/YbcL family protein
MGGSSGGATAGGGGGSGGNSGAFALTSSDLASGSMFSPVNTCAGKGSSPALAWTAGPAGTKSYAITFFDTTLVGQGNANGYHWVIWDIPATTLALPAALPAGASLSTPVMAKQSSPANPFDNYPANAYFGPCPNAVGQGDNTDTYAFTIYALGVEALTGNLSGVKNVDVAIQAATPLASAKLAGTSSAKPD